MSDVNFERKKVFSIEAREHEMGFLLTHCLTSEDDENPRYIELSEKAFGKPFEEGTRVRISLHYEPLTIMGGGLKEWHPLKDSVLFSYVGEVRYSFEDFDPITLGTPDMMRIYGRYGDNVPAGEFKLDLEQVLEQDSLRIARVSEEE